MSKNNDKFTYMYHEQTLFIWTNKKQCRCKLILGIPLKSSTSTPLTPSARISALNIVGDLLRKVGVSTVYMF